MGFFKIDPVEEATIPCETCGTPTRMTGTKRCDGCWEVEHRLAAYLRTGPKARALVRKQLAESVRPKKARRPS